MLVETFRKRNADIRKERIPYVSSLFSMWEQLLQQVEVETHSHGEIAKHLTRNLGTGLLEKTFHKKIQSRKAFLHRESMEAILNKAEETLQTVSDFPHDISSSSLWPPVNLLVLLILLVLLLVLLWADATSLSSLYAFSIHAP